MAIRSSDYLKNKFSNLKIPNGEDFSDLIDSSYNGLSSLSAIAYGDLTVFGNTTLKESVTAESILRCDNIIVKNSLNNYFKIIVTESGTVSAIQV